MPDSPYINRFLQPDTIIPGAANPQSWNRYSYVLNNPIQYTDPTGHRCVDQDEDGNIITLNCDTLEPLIPDNPKPKKKPHKPGEPLCETAFCEQLSDFFTYETFILDSISLFISGIEATLAISSYITAIGACIATAGVGCGIALEFAWGVDMATAASLGVIENTLGWASTGFTLANDVLLGNVGYDEDIGVYVGTDTVVSLRNSIVGSIPESILDFGASMSQYKYDRDRMSGDKSGGYVPLLSKDFLTQLFIEDWW